jgi:hypothetical protein
MLLPPWETVEVETMTMTPEPATDCSLAATLAQGSILVYVEMVYL